MNEVQISRVQTAELPAVIALFEREVYPDEPGEARVHFAGHAQGQADTFLARVAGELAGYVTIRWQSNNPLFRQANIPLIHHLAVFPAFQRRGIASRLMEAAERLIGTRATTAGITVGLFDAYGPAQRLYARRGYVPDGRGACQGQRPLTTGETVTLDDRVILWLTKDLAVSDAQAGAAPSAGPSSRLRPPGAPHRG
jgi:GNAT superfamily N-acetyltransferase